MQASSRPALVCRALEPFADHLFTTRVWRLGSAAPADRDAGWAEVAAALRVDGDRLIRVQQVHGVAVRRAGDASPEQADIIINNAAEVAAAVQAADCVPLLIADRTTRASAAVHSGWRGMAAGAAGRAVEALQRAFGSRPEDLVAAIGPSIGACCYEVGLDVRDAFARAGYGAAHLSRWFTDTPQPSPRNPSMPALAAERRQDHWFFDGWAAVAHQLEAAGVPADQVHVAALCTASHPNELCSYRRDGAPTGRLAAAIRPRR